MNFQFSNTHLFLVQTSLGSMLQGHRRTQTRLSRLYTEPSRDCRRSRTTAFAYPDNDPEHLSYSTEALAPAIKSSSNVVFMLSVQDWATETKETIQSFVMSDWLSEQCVLCRIYWHAFNIAALLKCFLSLISCNDELLRSPNVILNTQSCQASLLCRGHTVLMTMHPMQYA